MNSFKSDYFMLIASVCAAFFITACSVDNNEHDASITQPRVETAEDLSGQKEESESVVQPKKNHPMADQDDSTALASKTLPFAIAPAPMLGTNINSTQQSRLKTSSFIQAPVHIAPKTELNRENYLGFEENPVIQVSQKPVSTFSIDVDTAAYSNIRRLLMQGQLPPHNAVKAEELINYFSYQYPIPKDLTKPFSITTEIAPAPWNPSKHLLHIGIKGYDVAPKDIPASNLVFLVDVSGSMRTPNKLGLVKKSLKLLLKQLDKKDKVSLVVYAGAAGVVLEPTSAAEYIKIERAIDNLTAGGSTNGEAGIIEAYAMAEKGFIQDGINRVIIASDGDMNVGRIKISQLKELIQQKRESGVALTTLGFGNGNYNYALMEQLADVGNGNAAYIDNLLEAQKVLVNEMSSTLLTIAKDVKIQIEFSPKVSEYRLIGYENRLLKREDFNNDKVDAGDIGAGHTVTAVYELTLTGNPTTVDPLRYTNRSAQAKTQAHTDEIAFLKIRYKHPKQVTSQLISQAIKTEQILTQWENGSDYFRFSAAVAAFSQQLKGGKYLGNFTYPQIINLAQQSRGADNQGYRSEFIKLVELAKNLSVQKMASQ